MIKDNKSTWSWGQLAWAVSLVIILPNAIMCLFALNYHLERPYINVDYALVMLVFIANQRILGVVALAVAFFFDVLALVGQIFPILRISDTLYMAKFIGAAPIAYQITLLILFLVFIFLVFLFTLGNDRKNKLVFLVCINALIVSYGVSAIFMEKEKTVVWSESERSMISSQVIFGIDSRNTGFVEGLSVDGDIFGEKVPTSATEPWFDDLSRVDDKVLLIVNESWGVSNERIQSELTSPIRNAGNVVSEWEEGVIDFNGITVEAEIRELCSADLLHFNFEGHEEDLKGCIPNQLKQTGYNTFSFHGAAGLMYDRAKWYPIVGFDNRVFFENHSWPNRCYSFPGACDVDMADHVASSYATSDKVFGYWLTLNTHHQYDLRDLSIDVLRCDKVDVRPETETCRNLKLQHQFFHSLARIISKPQMSGVRVVVVSDHEPRISDKSEMAEYFEKGKVPWVSFLVR